MRTILFKSGSTITDITETLGEVNIISGAKIYIGSVFPFINLHFRCSEYASTVATMSAKYYDGTSFKDVINLIDGTILDGATIGQEGVVKFNVKKNESWQARDSEYITELSGKYFYDLYWIELSFSAALGTVNFSFLGDLFCSEGDLYKGYAKFSREQYKDAFGTSDWFDQRLLGTERVINWMKQTSHIKDSGQIIDYSELSSTTTHAIAEIIYNELGSDYEAERAVADNRFEKRIKEQFVRIDENMNTQDDQKERCKIISWSR